MTPREEAEYGQRQQYNQMDSQRYRNEPMEIERPHGNSVDMRKNLSGIVNYEKQQNLMPNNGSNVYTHHHNQSYSMGDYNNGQQSPYNNQYGGYNQPPPNNMQNPIYKPNNFFSNNQATNNNRPVQQPQQQMNIRQQNPINNYPVNTQNMQNPYNQQGYRLQQSY